MKNLLSLFNLSDAYEIQARILPAMLVVLPVSILIAQIVSARQDWLSMIGWGAGLEVVLAILVSKVGHAFGARLQGKFEREWGGLPTHAWVRPSDQTHSEQQKKVWRKAMSEGPLGNNHPVSWPNRHQRHPNLSDRLLRPGLP